MLKPDIMPSGGGLGRSLLARDRTRRALTSAGIASFALWFALVPLAWAQTAGLGAPPDLVAPEAGQGARPAVATGMGAAPEDKGAMAAAPQDAGLNDRIVETTLHQCALLDDASCVQARIALGDNVDLRDAAGVTPLFVAVGADSLAAAASLKAAGADPGLETPLGAPADYALAIGSPEMVRTLVGGDARRADGMLLRAVRGGDLAMLRLALSLGANPSVADASGASALALAVAERRSDLAAELLAGGASPVSAPQSAVDPLGIALLAGDAESLDMLLEAGGDPNRAIGGVTPLEIAVMRGDWPQTQRLLTAGADPKRRNSDGFTAGDIAAAIGQDAIATQLRGPAVIDLINAKATRGEIKKAIASGSDVDARDVRGTPAIVVAALASRGDVLADLLAAGADPKAVGSDGTGLVEAALAARPDEVRAAMIDRVFARLPAEEQRAVLQKKSSDGRSVAVMVASQLKMYRDGKQIYDVRFDRSMDQTQLKRLANEADQDGVTPFVAAILGDDYHFSRYFSQTLDLEATLPDGRSLYDLARAKGKWAALAGLPLDRALPAGLEPGSTPTEFASAKRELQQDLKDWGYYSGPVDGAFGAGSRAALKAMFEDRGRELEAMAGVVGGPYVGSLRFKPRTGQDTMVFQASVEDISKGLWLLRRFVQADGQKLTEIYYQWERGFDMEKSKFGIAIWSDGARFYRWAGGEIDYVFD